MSRGTFFRPLFLFFFLFAREINPLIRGASVLAS